MATPVRKPPPESVPPSAPVSRHGLGPSPAPPRREPAGATASGTYLLKRLLLGRPLATARLEHERLGKPTALAVFSSDNMSSVAYATEEILRILIPAVGIVAFTLVMPITIAVVLVEAILIFSYRQTIKAYPSAGGAYIVTKDNLGLLPAQLAGVALLVDYVLTVAVSVAAGVEAISSVYPLSVPVRVGLSLFFVWLIAYGNLLGVRESGRLFAVPTYVFIASLALTCVAGLYQVVGGHLHAFPVGAQVHAGGLSPGVAAVTLFVVLKAFASGGAAVTGVEAISNGVPAFRKPEWKNARTTLMYMGAILSASFLAVSYLAHRLHVIPVADESKSVLGQIGQAVYGNGVLGHALFLVLQISTTAILILAANTSFADFPRLASFHAGDAFMPRQLTKRGHKLVFSNGIIALALAASLVIVVFRASVTAMIPLYALGVFTSFTLSQSGMAKRHLRIKEPGWRLGLAINGFGAICTAVVAVIIAIVKFHPPGQFGGAWLVLLFVPLMVFVLTRVNKTYEQEEDDLLAGLEHVQRPFPQRHVAVVLCDDLDEKTLHAIQYAFTIQPQEIRVIHLATDPVASKALHQRWVAAELGLDLEDVECPSGRRGECLRSFLIERGCLSDDLHVTVIVPGPAHMSFVRRLRRGRTWSGLVGPLRSVEGVSVVVVRDHGGPGHHPVSGRMQLSPRTRHEAIILVDRLDRSVLKAIRYARTIDATDIRALHAAVDPHTAARLAEQWAEVGNVLGVPLDVEECFDRYIARTVSEYVHQVQAPNV
ncbi:MAG TPA: APC family permease, partial [Actinomycetota bacterium]|nr:APC family permease [Actinomycetota bacterium]